MIGSSQRNLRLCSIYALCTSLAIAVCANGVVTDLLLLHMEFDLAKFGIIKSCMYLLPAITYFASAGLLGRINRDLDVVSQAYLWRIILPIILTVAALLTRSQDFLLILAAVIYSLSFTCAMFANNTLFKIYRNALAPHDFNRGSFFLVALFNMPGAFFCLPAVYILNLFSGNRQAFLICLLVLQLFSLIFEYPGIRALKAVRFKAEVKPQRKKSLPENFSRIMANRDLVKLLTLTLFYGIWVGLISTYFVIYLIRCRGIGPQWIVAWELLLTVLGFLFAARLGKLADRFGYMRSFRFALITILAVQGLWGLVPESWIWLTFFALLVHNGLGVITMLCYSIGGTWSTSLAKAGEHELFIAAWTLLYSLGCFGGCQLAGPLLTCFTGSESEQFVYFFRCTLLLPLLITVLTFFRKRKEQAT